MHMLWAVILSGSVLKAVDGLAVHLGDDSNETLLFEGPATHNKRGHWAPRCNDSFKGKDGTFWSDEPAQRLADMVKEFEFNVDYTIDSPLTHSWRGHLVMREGQSTYCIHGDGTGVYKEACGNLSEDVYCVRGGGSMVRQVNDAKECGKESLFVALPIPESKGGGFFFVHYFSTSWLQAWTLGGGAVTSGDSWLLYKKSWVAGASEVFCDRLCHRATVSFYVQSLTDKLFELNVNFANTKQFNPYVVQRRNSRLGVSAQWANGSPRAEFAFERNYNCVNNFRCGHGWDLKENWKMVQCDEECTCLQCCKPST